MFVRIVALASAVLLAGCAYVAVGSLPEVNTPGPKIQSDLEVKAGTLLEPDAEEAIVIPVGE